MNLDKSVIDGTLFNKMLDVKNTGEWLSLTKKIVNDHFQLKNKQANFTIINKKFRDLCQTLKSQLSLSNIQHRMFFENFEEVMVRKFDREMAELTENVRLMLRKVFFGNKLSNKKVLKKTE